MHVGLVTHYSVIREGVSAILLRFELPFVFGVASHSAHDDDTDACLRGERTRDGRTGAGRW